MPKPPLRLTSQFDLFQLDMGEEMPDGMPRQVRIPLLPAGKYEHPGYGELEWTPEKFAQMQANFQAGATGFQPSVNFDHSSHNPFGGGSRAAGWLTALETDAGGLHARVELTPCGEEAIRKREYRYVSAEIAEVWVTSSGQAFANVVLGAALTNIPFHGSMPGLFAAAGAVPTSGAPDGDGEHRAEAAAPHGGSMTLTDIARKFFGLPDTASEAETTLAFVQRAAQPAVSAPVETQPAATPPPSLTANFVQLDRTEHERLLTLARQVEESDRQAQEARLELARQSATTAVAAYEAQGKITPAQRAYALTLALENPGLFKSLYDAAPAVVDLQERG
ncbi:MAG: phage protease, partial [Phaeospirillum sp.]|nr:phage protease [Phaeospirillum sp.]